MKTSEKLERGKMKISNPLGWVKGLRCNKLPGALTFCALGALDVRNSQGECLEFATERHPEVIYLNRAIPEGFEPDVKPTCLCPGCVDIHLNPDVRVALYNNAPSVTHADIMAWFDRAIAAARADEGEEDISTPALVPAMIPARVTEEVRR